jgi:hypothetical protein
LILTGDRVDYLAEQAEFVKTLLGILENPVVLIDPNHRELVETSIKYVSTY